MIKYKIHRLYLDLIKLPLMRIQGKIPCERCLEFEGETGWLHDRALCENCSDEVCERCGSEEFMYNYGEDCNECQMGAAEAHYDSMMDR